MDSQQTMRYSKGELELLRQFVESRPDALYVVRNHFLQLGLTEDETKFLQSIPKEILLVLKKGLVPSLEREVPFNQQATLYSRLNSIEQVNPEAALVHIEANDIIVEYLEQQYDSLGPDVEPTIILSDLVKSLSIDQKELRVQNMIAYNNIIPIVDGRLNLLQALVTAKVETPEQKKQRENANSTK